MRKRSFITLIIALVAGNMLFAQNSVEGIWKTVDHETGKEKSLVKIQIGPDGKLYGTIIKLFGYEKPEERICENCPEPFNGKKVIGMQIINGLKKDGNEWVGDQLLFAPDRKSYYDAKIWVEDGKLMVRGYIGWFYSTQTWLRASGEM